MEKASSITFTGASADQTLSGFNVDAFIGDLEILDQLPENLNLKDFKKSWPIITEHVNRDMLELIKTHEKTFCVVLYGALVNDYGVATYKFHPSISNMDDEALYYALRGYAKGLRDAHNNQG